jgi:DNA polymerase delta subunit 2
MTVKKATRNLNDTKYTNLSENFYIKGKKSYSCQYAPLYAERLTSMRAELKSAAIQKWSCLENPRVELKNLVDLVTNEKSIIIGTLYKEMKNKPNILRELADDENNSFVIQPISSLLNRKYIDLSEPGNDVLILEDELQRIVLTEDSQLELVNRKFLKSKFCTGLVIALLGYENEESKFIVLDYCFKQTKFTPYSMLNSATAAADASSQSKYVVFISGIELGNGDAKQDANNLYKLQLFVDFLSGDFIDEDDDNDNGNEYAARLKLMLTNTQRLIIAGNTLASNTQSKDMHNKAKYLTKNFIAGSCESIKKFDTLLMQLVGHLEVDVMPGEYDPSNLMVPQQPLHHCMFTRTIETKHKKNLHTATNPYFFSLCDDNDTNQDKSEILFLGTSGQFIDDIRRSTVIDDSIELMKLTLESGHLGPTCPDTLACYPYYGKDPFILKQLPHVYFNGNQESFKHDFFHVDNDQSKRVHLLSLPKFSITNSCVFLNINTFESEEIFF